MRIERSGVVGLLEIQTRGGGRNVVDDDELTEKFYEQTKVLIAGSGPPLRELYDTCIQRKVI